MVSTVRCGEERRGDLQRRPPARLRDAQHLSVRARVRGRQEQASVLQPLLDHGSEGDVEGEGGLRGGLGTGFRFRFRFRGGEGVQRVHAAVESRPQTLRLQDALEPAAEDICGVTLTFRTPETHKHSSITAQRTGREGTGTPKQKLAV